MCECVGVVGMVVWCVGVDVGVGVHTGIMGMKICVWVHLYGLGVCS